MNKTCVAAALFLGACSSLSDITEKVVTDYDLALADRATAELIGTDMEPLGMATLTQAPRGVLIRLDYEGLTPGWHGIHLHQIGDCSDPAFKSAGGHINPSGREHGLLNPDGPDNADMTNIFVGEDGTGAAELYSHAVSINGANGAPALLDENGSAFVIHVNEDDHHTQPIGGAGARAACGVIVGTE